MAANAGQLPNGLPILYLPHLLHAGAISPIVAQNPHNIPIPLPMNLGDPLPAANPPTLHFFPVPGPYQIPTGVPLRCKPMYRAPLHTSASSHNNVPDAVQAMAQPLQFLKRSGVLWDNAKAYGETAFGNPNAGVQTIIPQLPRVNTWNTAGLGLLDIPDALQQAEAAYGLQSWFFFHERRGDRPVNSEPSVQDEFHVQVLEPLNLLLRTRYPRAPVTAGDWKSGGNGPSGPLHGLFIPYINRACRKDHTIQGDSKKAGYPDFLSRSSSQHSIHNLIFEIKTWWTYTNSTLDDIFTDETTASVTGAFDWAGCSSGLRFKFLKQLWAEMIFFNTSWGVLSNGHRIAIFAKTGPAEMTFSEYHILTEIDIHQTLFGLACAAIDEPAANVRLAGVGTNLIDILCPPHTRLANW